MIISNCEYQLIDIKAIDGVPSPEHYQGIEGNALRLNPMPMLQPYFDKGAMEMRYRVIGLPEAVAIASRDIEQTDERFLSFGEGVWIYSQTYSLTVTISEAVREVLTPIEETRIDEDERDRRREEFFRQYMTPIGVVLPPHIQVVCGLWRSRIDEVASQESSQLEAVFRTGGLDDLTLGTDEVREQD